MSLKANFGKIGKDAFYSFDAKSGVLTVSGSGEMFDYDDCDNNPSPFFENEDILELIIENGITSIGKNAFSDCTSLKTVVMANSVETIKDFAFCNCEWIKTIIFSNSLKSIGYSSFMFCEAIKSLDLPESIEIIEESAFDFCTDLKTVYIPKSIKTISKGAFVNCSDITDVYYAGNESEWEEIEIGDDNDYLLDASIHFDYNTDSDNLNEGKPSASASKVCGENAFYEFDAPTGTLTIGGKGAMFDYDLLYPSPFSMNEKIKKVYVNGEITRIGNYAFKDCRSLETVVLISGVKTVGEFAFHNCEALRIAELPESVCAIEPYAFKNCYSLEEISLPESMDRVNESTFEDCVNLKKVRLSYNTFRICENAFKGCESLEELVFFGDVTNFRGLIISPYGCDEVVKAKKRSEK